MKVELRKTFQFEAAHLLPNLAKSHKYKIFKDSAEEDEWNSIFQPIYSS